MLDKGGEEGTSHKVVLAGLFVLEVLDEGGEGHHMESSQQGSGR